MMAFLMWGECSTLESMLAWVPVRHPFCAALLCCSSKYNIDLVVTSNHTCWYIYIQVALLTLLALSTFPDSLVRRSPHAVWHLLCQAALNLCGRSDENWLPLRARTVEESRGMAISETWVWINGQLQSLHNFQQKFGSNCSFCLKCLKTQFLRPSN